MTRPFQLPRRADPIRFDEIVLTAFCQQHGGNAEYVLADILERIEARLPLAGSLLGRGNVDDLRAVCLDLKGLSAEIGMITLDACVDNLLTCLDADDGVAATACAARLGRLRQDQTTRNWIVA